jgi:hypothetical protein
MVKKSFCILIITILLIALATFEVVAVKKLNTNLLKDVYYLQQITIENKENINNISKEIIEIKNNWDSAEPLLCLMFNHKDLSAITDTLTRLCSYVENNDYDNAIAEVNLLKKYSEKNKHIMGFNLQNLL